MTLTQTGLDHSEYRGNYVEGLIESSKGVGGCDILGLLSLFEWAIIITVLISLIVWDYFEKYYQINFIVPS